MKIVGKPEPVVVAITWDDLWLGVKCQPNLEIAGSPRKVYRDRGMQGVLIVELLNGTESASNLPQPNSEYQNAKTY
jgi:hypothetical protein